MIEIMIVFSCVALIAMVVAEYVKKNDKSDFVGISDHQMEWRQKNTNKIVKFPEYNSKLKGVRKRYKKVPTSKK